MPFDIDKVRVDPLTGLHRLDAFCCSYEPIQQFCRTRLAEAHDTYSVRAFVATHDGDPRIVGYYYLCLSTISHDEAGLAVEGGFMHMTAVPTVYLGMFGVDRRLKKKGIGKRMMRDAFRRVETIATNAGTYALTLDAVDEEAAEYYEKFDFQRFAPGERKMFLELPTILASNRALDEAEQQAA
ncbi:GNAT family N-acetyltransferase [Phenylobacterium sp. J426]|uniref:GNAT family N-acetyltransferase n=1 Tax=Phenylobacterium sp. J426 TaxID=2898439 RepID=UPI0021509CD0|nr:GNAT family N-acetyltransferase [Phenylobacterium sp. J426]MCR5874398.1 GNAT family N-acetyltransferase [Phenylobacterium sp. J426]